ncbi:MAG: protein TolR [Gammaproteobacteria bacterium]|nr:MAG: protein TolR [Gammaproteobacteria bacterium]RLA21922.1 MAG: protein TolR [Gammaproteobacteria bacterium]
MAEINVVPYIDVTLVLLIIFMITAPLIQQGVEVDLPQAEAKELLQEQEQEPPIIVSIDAEGLYYMDIGENPDEPLDLESIKIKVAAVLRQKPKTNVVVGGDSRIGYGKVITLMVALQTAGVENVGLMTQSPDTGQ